MRTVMVAGSTTLAASYVLPGVTALLAGLVIVALVVAFRALSTAEEALKVVKAEVLGQRDVIIERDRLIEEASADLFPHG